MVGLGGLEPPTSPLSVLRPGSRSVILRNTGRLANPKLILWRELPEQRDEALQKSNKRWLVLGLRPKEHDSRMGFWRYAWTFAKSQVQRHQHAIFRAATLGEHRIVGTREFLASKPAPRRIDAYSVGRFSSTLNFKL